MYHEKYGFQKEVYRPIDTARKNPNPFLYKHGEKVVYPCSPGMATDHRHGTRVIPQCGSWECVYCGPLKKAMLKKEINNVRQRHGKRWIFTVLTFSSVRGRARNYRTRNFLTPATQKQYYRKFVVAARKIIGTDAYCMIPEWQKNGTIHFNIVWFGVEGFTDCVGKNDLDLRRVCRRCNSCQLREVWKTISGAPRSTHGYIRGSVGGYATKYVTKSTHERPVDDNTRRYSFSRACRRSIQIVPVYQYLYLKAREGNQWHLGAKKQHWQRNGRDYLAPSTAYLGIISEFKHRKAHEHGERVANNICGKEHDLLCDTMVYMSPTRLRAWGSDDAMWREVERIYGKHTLRTLRSRLAEAMWRSRNWIRGWKHDGDRYYNLG